MTLEPASAAHVWLAAGTGTVQKGRDRWSEQRGVTAAELTLEVPWPLQSNQRACHQLLLTADWSSADGVLLAADTSAGLRLLQDCSGPSWQATTAGDMRLFAGTSG